MSDDMIQLQMELRDAILNLGVPIEVANRAANLEPPAFGADPDANLADEAARDPFLAADEGSAA